MIWSAGNGVIAASAPIHDSAHVFSAAAIHETEPGIRAIKSQYHIDVLVETFSSASLVARLFNNLKQPDARAHFFDDWAKRRARQAGPYGIYILICKEPAPVEVRIEAGNEALAKAFTAEDCKELEGELRTDSNQGHFDKALKESVHFIHQRLENRLGVAAEAPPGFPWPAMLSIIVVLTVLWSATEIVKAFRAPTNTVVAVEPAQDSYQLASIFTRLFATVKSNPPKDSTGHRSDLLVESSVPKELAPENYIFQAQDPAARPPDAISNQTDFNL